MDSVNHAREVSMSMEYLSDMGVMMSRVAWRSLFEATEDLDYGAINLGTKYLELVDPSMRVACFHKLRFSPTAREFFQWISRHGYDSGLAASLEWATHSSYGYVFGGFVDYLMLVEGGSDGFPCDDMVKLATSELRLGSGTIVDLWPSDDGYIEPKVPEPERVKEVFTLTDVLPAGYVAEIQEVSNSAIGVVTVADLVGAIARVVGADIVTGFQYSSLGTDQEWRMYGVGAVTEVSALGIHSGGSGGLNFMSITNAMRSYAALVGTGEAMGLRIKPLELVPGYVLVRDDGVTVEQTMQDLVDHKTRLKRVPSGEFGACSCGGGRGHDIDDLLESRSLGRDVPSWCYEFTGADFWTHHRTCTKMEKPPETSYVCTQSQVVSAIPMAFRRRMRDKRLFSGSGLVVQACELGFRLQEFECRYDKVRSDTDFGNELLRELFGVGQKECGALWYSCDVNRAIDVFDSGGFGFPGYQLMMDKYGIDRVVAAARVLLEWYEFVDKGEIKMRDLVNVIGQDYDA